MPDIRDTLAELDRRLADLRHQITDLVQEPEPAPPPPPPARRPLPPPTPEEISPGAAGATGGSAAEAESARARAAAEGVAQLGTQLQVLLTMRERLLEDARDLLTKYERRLQELETEDTSEIQAALDSLLSAPGLPETWSAGPVAVSSRPAFFEGTVSVIVSGAQRIQTIQVMEDALTRARNVESVYIRRWHAGQMTLEVSLAAGVELIGELNRVLPFAFAVQAATGEEIVITLEGER